ncbi:hypothetical protein DL766_004717 [Monosporascus sp. MC13-8B]|uniref:Tat pathway signal sequence n=1 Tax=Monosporascus cannonballus TaxID=155416 RepID=A0ABY0H0J8_9PEZI|nr:hypothetical protein DL762_007110 [Monosporascus cannonballus]RYP01315.1 hypothetical protein DL763_000287 [Monosporascus cannonballus]RYP30769.1 hypothetical protein DL766_004717 [Monosporascus sp. MC13-8B]
MFYKDQYAALSDNNPAQCLSDGENEDYPLTRGESTQRKRVSKRTSRRRYVSIVIAVLLGQTLYTALVLFGARELYYKPMCPRLAAPDNYHAWDVLEYREVKADHEEPDEHHPYLGIPSPELDPFRNRVPASEKYLYNGLHRDYYYSNMTEKEEKSHNSHMNHCLHRLMDALKCNPDMSPLTLHWVVNEVAPVVNWPGSSHTCADWSKVTSWAKEHQIAPSGKQTILQVARHPLYASLIDDQGHADFLDQEQLVDWEKLFSRPDYPAWANEHGIPQGTVPSEDLLKNSHTEQRL